jgi:hypothetical protein
MSTNGKEGTRITVTVVEENYVVFQVAEHAPGVDPTKALSQCLIDWYKTEGASMIWAAVPIVRDGQTWAIHVWYE